MTTKTFIKQLEASKKRIAAERDKLREMISEAEDLGELCDRAIDDIERAADSLSELL